LLIGKPLMARQRLSMKSGTRLAIIVACVFFLGSAALVVAQERAAQKKEHVGAAEENRLALQEGWTLQTSAKVEAKGEVISTAKFSPAGWHRVSVPTTVVAALVKDKTLPDPFFAMNLRSFQGVTYPIGANFSNVPMAPDSPYAVSWWYRKAFEIPAGYKGKTVWLKFDGINYRANIWLNGKQIADSDKVAGAWRTYDLNVTETAKPGAENVLAVQVFSATDHDLAITFVDWNPAPPDRDMGLFRDVYLSTSGPVALRYPTVVSKVNSPANDRAELSVTAQVKNATDHPVRGKLTGGIEKVNFEQDVELGQVQPAGFYESALVVADADGKTESLRAYDGIGSGRFCQR
jgi:exo-1,4-beta-D-glucosaminidase